MRKVFLLALLFLFQHLAVGQRTKRSLTEEQLNQLATDYVRLGLAIGQYDGDFVDAYYGPDSLKPVTPKAAAFPKADLLAAASRLIAGLRPFTTGANTLLSGRAKWITGQLIATQCRIRLFSGEQLPFDVEVKALFGMVPPVFTEAYFKKLVAQLNGLLSGKGTVQERFQQLAGRFIIPKEKVDTVFKATIAESRRVTRQHYALPETENFRLEFVSNKPWSGYNWYQGGFNSLIQINADITAYIEKAIDVASHEGYPGHHVYNTLLEKNLYKDKGWIEISLYPLFSPQSLIAEGSANYGIEVVFPGAEKIKFTKNVLLPLAGLDTTGISLYFKVLGLREKLKYADTEVTRRLVNGLMTDTEAIRWAMDYNFADSATAARSLAFKKKYRSYVINYTFGQDLVRNYIERRGGTDRNPAKRWALFEWLLSHEVATADLMVKRKAK